MADTQELKTYRGNCHCGANVFEAQLPEIKKLTVCNCSICSLKGSLWQSTTQDKVTWAKGGPESEELTTYTFGTHRFEHKFCKTCGTAVMFIGRLSEGAEPMIGVNARAFQHGLIQDPWKMETTVFDGKSLGEPYKQPEHKGPKPSTTNPGDKLYTGSCHCGALTASLSSPPLDATFPSPVYQCNCSGCVRFAGACAWPAATSLVLSGADEHATGYSFGMLRAWRNLFCRHCGVFVGREPNPISEEMEKMLPQEARKWTVDAQHLRPMNVRIFGGLDVGSVPMTYMEGYENIPPPYVNP